MRSSTAAMPTRWFPPASGSRPARSSSCASATSSLPFSTPPRGISSMRKIVHRSAIALALVAFLGACSERASLDPAQQSGGDPTLPEAQRFLVPPIQVPDGIGWKQRQTPKVAAGLKIERIAGDLLHPRQLCLLPNGDVLVV